MLFTRYYKKYSKVREAKETVDLKIWQHKHVIYKMGNVGKKVARTLICGLTYENHEIMQQIKSHYDLFSSLTAMCLYSRPQSSSFSHSVNVNIMYRVKCVMNVN